VRRPDGTDRLLAISVSPIVRDGAEGVQGVHGIARDITEERRIERDRERVRQHYERLVKTSPDAIYALDTAGRFTEVSDATTRLLRRPVQELIGTSFAALIAPEDLPMAMASFNRKLADEVETTEINIHMIRGDGERRLVNIRATQIRDGDRVIGSHGIGRDVTEESAREEQLRRAERLASVGTLVAGVAHELNNPLTAIAGFAELMLMEPHSPDDAEMLRLTMREATRAAKIVADLRLIASDTQAARAPREAVDLNDVVRHALTLQRYTLETGNIDVVEQLAADLPPVQGTATELEQVVLNLIVNARQALEQHAAPDRRMTITTRATADGVTLGVADNGPGIPADEVGRVFDPFFST
jgi:two-component system NtrC family sensor kinase